MRSVLVVCEGHTEREFCNRVLAEPLGHIGLSFAGTLVGTPQRRQGGIRRWAVYRKELLKHASGHNGRIVGVLVDYYAMPQDWPGRTTSVSQPPDQRGKHIEDALRADLQADLGDRFIPCVQLHEFESLLFVDPEATAMNIAVGSGLSSYDELMSSLEDIRESCGGSVEAINDSPTSAPSKRLSQLCPAYDKVAWGVPSAKDAGIDTLRAGCPWLDRWLGSLESIGGA